MSKNDDGDLCCVVRHFCDFIMGLLLCKYNILEIFEIMLCGTIDAKK